MGWSRARFSGAQMNLVPPRFVAAELHVGGIAGAYGLLCLDQELFTTDRNRHALDRPDLDSAVRRPRVIDAAVSSAILTTL
jgi:hypothetical protein